MNVRTLHLYSHVHGNLRPLPGSMDVGAAVWGRKAGVDGRDSGCSETFHFQCRARKKSERESTATGMGLIGDWNEH